MASICLANTIPPSQRACVLVRDQAADFGAAFSGSSAAEGPDGG
jgi:hypothetical protein